MRKKITLFAIGCAIVALGMVSCQKENSNPSDIRYDEAVAKKFVSQVNWFLTTAKDAKAGKMEKSSETMPLDSIFWYIDATLNYKYGFATEESEKLQLDTVMVSIPLVKGGQAVYVNDALTAYNTAVELLKAKYIAIQESTKFLKVCVIQNAGMTPDNNAIVLRVIGQFGTGALTAPAPGSTSYWWERDSYDCNQIQMGKGAPNIFDAYLTDALRARESAGIRLIYTNLKIEEAAFAAPTQFRTPNDVLDNYCDYKLFYAASSVSPITDETMCLVAGILHQQPSEMSYYPAAMRSVITAWLATQPYRSFASVTTQSIRKYTDDQQLWKIMHTLRLTHAIIIAVDDGEDPINLTD